MIVVVTGAPCSGKSTHVQMHATPGDVVVDMDRLALALSADGTPHHQYPQHVRHVARYARNAAVSAAINVQNVAPQVRVWVIDTFADRSRWRGLGAEVVVCDPGFAECTRRAEQQRPEWVQSIIAEWYAKFSSANV